MRARKIRGLRTPGEALQLRAGGTPIASTAAMPQLQATPRHPLIRRRRFEYLRSIPRSSWRQILMRTKTELSDDNVSLIAAGVAFYGLMAVFPGIAAMVSLYGLIADPASAARFFNEMPGLPYEARTIMSEQAQRVAATPASALSLGLIGALLLTIYSASRAVSAIITALNISYDEGETRGFIRLTMLSFGLTAGILVFVVFSLGFIVGVPAIIDALRLPTWMSVLLHLTPWPILGVCAIAGLAILYRYGPARRPASSAWLRIGAAVATVLWLVGSASFSFYVANFGSYNETYGSVGAIVVLLMWFYLSAYVIILGAELNAEIELETTTRPPAIDPDVVARQEGEAPPKPPAAPKPQVDVHA